MEILIWKNGRWCPFPEEEVLRLRGLGEVGLALFTPDDDPSTGSQGMGS